jgi:enoyl-CoA hydratase/carnithine racemase
VTVVHEEAGADLHCERVGTTAVVRLDRPAARNALSSGLVRRLSAVLAALDHDPAVRVAVLTGAPPGFCAGSDLKELASMSVTGMMGHEARTGQAVRAIAKLGIPVVAAVEGFAIGGGFLLAAGCDLVVTAQDARWHLPEAKLGWVPPWGLHALVARAGPVVARRLAWGEQPLTGVELHRLGVVDAVAEPGRALPIACGLAARISAVPAHAVSSTKRALAGLTAGAAAESLDARTTWMFGQDCRTGTARASLATFAHKRQRGRG